MQLTPENFEWAVEKIEELSALPGAPTKDVAVRAVAKALLKIVGEQRKVEQEDEYGKTVVLREAIDERASGESLIGLLLTMCERFPTPITMRRLYETQLGHTPADGKSYVEFGE